MSGVIRPVVMPVVEYPHCIKCSKAVYPADPQIKFDGALYHMSCAKCHECGCQLTVFNFTNNRIDVNLLCKTHYISRFMSQGGSYERYTPTPAFMRVLEEKRQTQKEMETAHKLLLEKQLRDEQEKHKKEVAEERVMYAVNGTEFDINEILRMIPRESFRGTSNGKATFLQSIESVYGESSISAEEERGTYRTLRTVKEFNM